MAKNFQLVIERLLFVRLRIGTTVTGLCEREADESNLGLAFLAQSHLVCFLITKLSRFVNKLIQKLGFIINRT